MSTFTDNLIIEYQPRFYFEFESAIVSAQNDISKCALYHDINIHFPRLGNKIHYQTHSTLKTTFAQCVHHNVSLWTRRKELLHEARTADQRMNVRHRFALTVSFLAKSARPDKAITMNVDSLKPESTTGPYAICLLDSVTKNSQTAAPRPTLDAKTYVHWFKTEGGIIINDNDSDCGSDRDNDSNVDNTTTNNDDNNTKERKRLCAVGLPSPRDNCWVSWPELTQIWRSKEIPRRTEQPPPARKWNYC